MKEHPILFSAPMVQAILDGRKTMTRRVIRQFPATGYRWGGWIVEGARGDEGKATIVPEGNMPYMAQGQIKARCPYGEPGDRLWVRETFGFCDFPGSGVSFGKRKVLYRADGETTYDIGKWRPSIHMPRWASRIDLEITAVRVKRVQDISNGDARAEGVQDWGGDEPGDYRGGFRELWDSINAKRGYGWGANPWVWVVEFKRIEP